MTFSLRHAIALLAVATLGLTVGVPFTASGMSLEDAAEIFMEVLSQWLTS